MAISYSEGYTNTTSSTEKLTPVVIDQTVYSIEVAQSGSSVDCYLSNMTASSNQAEVIHYGFTKQQNMKMKEQPAQMYSDAKVGKIVVGVEEKRRATSSTDDWMYKDGRHKAELTFTWDLIDSIDQSVLIADLERLIGSLKNSDGTGWRIEELMRGSVNPTVNDSPTPTP